MWVSIKHCLKTYKAIKQLQFGDVILCYKGNSKSISGQIIKAATGSSYTHAAFCLGDGVVAEAVPGGVRKTKIRQLLKDYDYIGVLRSTFWEKEGIQVATQFIEALMKNDTGYNYIGAVKSAFKRKSTNKNLIKNLNNYFVRGIVPARATNAMFCSQLVVEIFIESGYIDESATILLNPAATTPTDIKDPVFGWFLQYIMNSKDTVVPENDELKKLTKHPLAQT